MTTTLKYTNNKPALGGGIFLPKDVSKILDLPYHKVRRWIFEFWDKRFGKEWAYSFGDIGNKAIDFHTLIEFYVFYQLRENGLSSQKIQKTHHELSKIFKTKYPFAHAKISTDGKNIWFEKFENLVNTDGKNQISLKLILAPFLKKIEYGANNIAEKYYPLNNSKNIVVDPKRQFGQPIVTGTNVKAAVIYSLFEGGENSKDIGHLYSLTEKQVNDAILYYQKTA